jgi:acyl-CoA synthetase (AMP-forming)/AMP-acid ligase II
MRNRTEVAVLAFAAQRLGAVVVPLSYRASPPEVARLLATARPAAVVVDAAIRDAVAAGTTAPILDVDGRSLDALPAGATEYIGAPSASDRLGAGASMVFTSGTTDSPKAAVRTRGDAELGRQIARCLGLTAARYIASGPMYHSGPWTCGLMALSSGGAIVLQRKFEPEGWVTAVIDHAVEATFTTPTQLRRIVTAVEEGAPRPTSLRSVVVSGEPFPPELKTRAVAALGPCVVECYGCTELGPLAWMPATDLLHRPSASGRPLPGVEIAAFRGEGAECRRAPAGVIGVLRARTPLAFDGYVGVDGDGCDRTADGWTSVGDVGFLDDEGYVHLVGRADDMIITGGVNVFPADVERVLLEHPAVEECAVVGVPDPDWGEAVCAVVVAADPISLAEMRTWLKGRISDEKRPRRLVVVGALPTTATDKLSRRALRDALSEMTEPTPRAWSRTPAPVASDL